MRPFRLCFIATIFLLGISMLGACQPVRGTGDSGAALTATPQMSPSPAAPPLPTPSIASESGTVGAPPASPTAPSALMMLPVVPVRPEPAPSNKPLPFLSRPFEGDFPLLQFFDHDLPYQYGDKNGYLLTAWGQKTSGVDGHNGYDWSMPEGTPIYAAADGLVVRAGVAAPFYCVPSKRMTNDSLAVELAHGTPTQGLRIITHYGHLSKTYVENGQKVQAGQLVGLSGESGCVEGGPHMHFSVRPSSESRKAVYLDPYGWEGSGEDPWRPSETGDRDPWMWLPGQAPLLYREAEPAPEGVERKNALVAITLVRWMGWKDDVNPNNEAVRISASQASSDTGPFSLAGYTLVADGGAVFTFPPGARVAPGVPLWVFTGSGAPGDNVLFGGYPQGVWNDMGGCARLFDAQGDLVDEMPFGGSACPPGYREVPKSSGSEWFDVSFRAPRSS